jgi:hypothetical protein
MAVETRPLHPVKTRGLILSALLVFTAVAWWTGRSANPHSQTVVAVDPPNAGGSPAAPKQWVDAAPGVRGNDDRAEPSTRLETAPDTTAEASFSRYVAGKYRFLEMSEGLRAALMARERVAVAINTAKQGNDAATRDAIPMREAELAALDRKIGTLLRAGDLAAFEVLKDSDIEQFQLDDYAGGVSAIAPLSHADQKAILYAKLGHRQRFREVLARSGLTRGDLSSSERRQAFADVSRALDQATNQYLQEVRQYLYNEEQFALLRNYESTERDAELEKLRDIANLE